MLWTVIAVSFIAVIFIYGFSEMVRAVWLKFLRPNEDPPRMLLIFLKDEACVQQLRSAQEYLSWESRKDFSGIVAVDCGLSEKNRQTIKDIALQNANVFFGNEDLKNIIAEHCGTGE